MRSVSSLKYYTYSDSRFHWLRPFESLATSIQRGANPLQQYQYQPLGNREIRLIRIIKGTGSDILKCSLTHHRLQPDLEFVALSYVWGESVKRDTVLCNGSRLGVTASLHAALWELRESQSGDEMLIWADAICIDQEDDAEKTVQVRMMGDVYRTAHPVIAWLGVESDSDQQAIDLLYRISSGFKRLLHDGTLKQYSQTQDLPLKSLGLPRESDKSWECLRELLLNPWFTRVWIIQEYILPQQVLFLRGKSVIESGLLLAVAWQADHFSVLQTILATQSPTSTLKEYNINSAKLFDLKLKQAQKFCLIDLLDMAEDYGSKDPRDRIFALISLCDDFEQNIIDYQRSLTDLLVDVAFLGLTGGGSPNTFSKNDLFSYIELRDDDYDLPSWVPDWTKRREKYPLIHVYPSNSQLSASDCDLSLDMELGLTINAKLFDHVRAVVDSSGVLAPMNSSHEYLFSMSSKIVSWNDECFALAKSVGNYPTNESISEAFWRTLIFNSNVDFERATPEYGRMYHQWRSLFASLPRLRTRHSLLQKNVYDWYAAAALSVILAFTTIKTAPIVSRSRLTLAIHGIVSLGVFMALNRCSRGLRHAALGPILDEYDAATVAKEARPFNMIFQTLTAGRDFCVTRSGLMGWVPRGVNAGDALCVFQGSRLPFALSVVNGNYRIRGDAYVHGMMDYQPWQSASIPCQKIRLL